ncbi:MAG: hypothetical protein Ct9H90mP16_19850 [Candidatus Poseidoniales archaeon]|nr:MAG: hypothetical protein Ct9H90mP16_19850 [Candidatus Poseidoniales archaeon]
MPMLGNHEAKFSEYNAAVVIAASNETIESKKRGPTDCLGLNQCQRTTWDFGGSG